MEETKNYYNSLFPVSQASTVRLVRECVREEIECVLGSRRKREREERKGTRDPKY